MWEGIQEHQRVLLVEDAPFLRYAFGRLLRMHGFDVCEATDGQAAWDCVHKFRPQLVVTDLMMPIMDGVEFIKRLRSDPRTAELPVLAITADSSQQMETKAREAGAIEFVTKPVDLTTLLERLRSLSH